MQPEVERRSIREVRAKDEGKIEGYAAVFNSLSEELWGFREVIMPGAFDRALKEEHDVRALVNHDPNQILGRTKSGTLKLSVDDHGLLAEIDPPDTQAARDALTSIRRGDLDGMSFAFRTLTDAWRMEDGVQIRELLDLELLDVSVVAYPAYPETQVSARALEHVKAAKELPPPEPQVNTVAAARLRMAGQ
jgi:Escherichia/Staphylococcus phage prohead protease